MNFAYACEKLVGLKKKKRLWTKFWHQYVNLKLITASSYCFIYSISLHVNSIASLNKGQ